MHKELRKGKGKKPTVTSVDEDDEHNDGNLKHGHVQNASQHSGVTSVTFPFPFQQIMEDYPPYGLGRTNQVGPGNQVANPSPSGRRGGRGGPKKSPVQDPRFTDTNDSYADSLVQYGSHSHENRNDSSYPMQSPWGGFDPTTEDDIVNTTGFEIPYGVRFSSTSSATKASTFYVPSHIKESPITGLGKKIVSMLPQSDETKRKLLEEERLERGQELNHNATNLIRSFETKIRDLEKKRSEAIAECAQINKVLKKLKRSDRSLYNRKMELFKVIQRYDMSIRTTKIQLETIQEGRQKVIDQIDEMGFKKTMGGITKFNKSMMETENEKDSSIQDILSDIQEVDDHGQEVFDIYGELDTRSQSRFSPSEVNQMGESPFAHLQSEIDGMNETSSEEEKRLGSKYSYDENNPSGDDVVFVSRTPPTRSNGSNKISPPVTEQQSPGNPLRKRKNRSDQAYTTEKIPNT